MWLINDVVSEPSGKFIPTDDEMLLISFSRIEMHLIVSKSKLLKHSMLISISR